jgi:hypothetical protein
VAEPRRAHERHVSAPLVLALASGMLAVAVVVWVGSEPSEPELPPASPSTLRVDDSTPERAAEGFYDAWRRRRWEQALAVSVGTARAAVVRKQARDEDLAPEDRVVVERMWDALARAPLTLMLDEAEILPENQLRLRGTAEYRFVDRPYRRRVEFVVVPADGRYRVAEMTLGEVLTELPELFRGTAEEEQP